VIRVIRVRSAASTTLSDALERHPNKPGLVFSYCHLFVIPLTIYYAERRLGGDGL